MLKAGVLQSDSPKKLRKHVEARGSTWKQAEAGRKSVACFEGGGGVKAILWTACCCQKASSFQIFFIF